ncbi:mandelate racemase [Chromatiales bacterium (ex Bugula neritina AB1)]|nr:mandelate racemase [Chromatiales bacterium (ex Bugula neritina AB1)]
MSFTIEKATTIVLRSPVDTPVQTSFGIMKDRPALFLVLEDSQGNTGVGEVWCNFPSCGAEHRQQLLETAILPALIGHEFADPESCFVFLQKQFQRLAVQAGEPGPIAQSIAGIDIGLWDLVTRRSGQPLHRLLGSRNARIAAYCSGINPTGATDTFLRCRDEGYTSYKLKIGFGDDIDYPNLESICSKLASGEQLMVDANQAWSLEQALTQVERLSGFPLTWLEEPMLANSPDEQWTILANATAIPLAAGENMADTATFTLANESEWLGVMQPDICKWGGFSGVLPVAREALGYGKQYCPHYLGGGIGLMASAHVLAAAGGTGLLEIDSNPNPLRAKLYSPVIENGQATLSDEPGLGIDPAMLQALANDPAIIRSQ